MRFAPACSTNRNTSAPLHGSERGIDLPTNAELLQQVNRLGTELAKRAHRDRILESYYDGSCPIPKAITHARVTNAYRMLIPFAEAPWGSLVVDSIQDRLEVAGVRSMDPETDERVWGIWQDNGLDSESKLAHSAALTTGRAFAIVWPDDDGNPEVTIESSEQVIIEYRSGSRRHRVAALRYWVEDKRGYVTLYRPDGIYKFVGPKNSTEFSGTQWERRDVEDETWPLNNPLGIVPVVELAVNRRLKPGPFGFARGEFANCIGLIDRINLLTFLGLVVAFWMGFPLRGVIGEKILKDDDGKVIPLFDAHASGLFQIENSQASIVEYKAADRKNLSIFGELDQLATISKTPRHYFPMENGMSNLSADAIRASEGALHAKTPTHKSSLGEGHLEILRLCGMMHDDAVNLSPRATLLWKDHESRSNAERADAATKLASIGLPVPIIAEKYLGFTQDEINRLKTDAADNAIAQLLAEAAAAPSATAPPVDEDATAAEL